MCNNNYYDILIFLVQLNFLTETHIPLHVYVYLWSHTNTLDTLDDTPFKYLHVTGTHAVGIPHLPLLYTIYVKHKFQCTWSPICGRESLLLIWYQVWTTLLPTSLCLAQTTQPLL